MYCVAVVYLDADTIVARNIDELFLCDGFCGVLRHSERLNTGVFVLQPDHHILEDMLLRIETTPSYTGGDQGFLNEFFSNFSNSPFFDPLKGILLSKAYPRAKDGHGIHLARIPTLYNADLGLYILNSNRWTVPESEIGVIHYTLATFKPWDWWSSWILGTHSTIWQGLRRQLSVHPIGPNAPALRSLMNKRVFFGLLLPWVFAFLMIRRWCWGQGLGDCARCCVRCASCYPSRTHHHNTGRPEIPRHVRLIGGGGDSARVLTTCSIPIGLSSLSAVVGIVSILVGLGTSVMCIVPRQVRFVRHF